MTGLLAVLHQWVDAAERLAGRLPELSAAIARGSWPAALVALALGVALLVAGSRLGRVLAAVAAAGLGWFVAAAFLPAVDLWNLPPQTAPWAAALVLGVLALGVPEVYPIVAGAVPGALLGLHVAVAGKAWLGAAAGAVALALLALWLRRLVLAATAAALGAVVMVAAAVALGGSVPSIRALAHRPLVVTGVIALLAVAGTAYQLGTTRRVRAGWGGQGQPLRQ